jgi:hypothetical protein
MDIETLNLTEKATATAKVKTMQLIPAAWGYVDRCSLVCGWMGEEEG